MVLVVDQDGELRLGRYRSWGVKEEVKQSMHAASRD